MEITNPGDPENREVCIFYVMELFVVLGQQNSTVYFNFLIILFYFSVINCR